MQLQTDTISSAFPLVVPVDVPKFDLIVVDVSFISLFPVIGWLVNKLGQVETVALYKPQFEMGRMETNFTGVAKNSNLIKQELNKFLEQISNLGWLVQGIHFCSIKGAKGNQEIFIWLKPQP